MIRCPDLDSAIIAGSNDVWGLQIGAEALSKSELHALGLAKDHSDALGSIRVAIENQFLGDRVERFIP